MAFKAPAQFGIISLLKIELKTLVSNRIWYIILNVCEEDYIGKTTRVCSIRMKKNKYDPKSHVFEHHHKVGHIIDFGNVKTQDRAK